MNLETARKLYNYNPDTGVITNKISRGAKVLAGRKAGCMQRGYRVLQTKGKMYMAHRIAWLLFYGELPLNEIDHINHNRSDNRITNIRSVTHAENQRNARLQKNNKWGISGVVWIEKHKKWRANIWVNNQNLHLGYHIDYFEACCSRKSAEHKFGFHKNHGRL